MGGIVRLLVTGGAGFIGSNFLRWVLSSCPDVSVLNFDKLTYAGNLENLADLSSDLRYEFIRGDIADSDAVASAFRRPLDAVIHFAAETHVDRSIEDSSPFLRTNVLGTQLLLDAARRHRLSRFLHISTDEVYGSAAPGQDFAEDARLAPSSPYAASKAAADLLVCSYLHTYSFPAILLRCTNNYGPYQFPEKVIPLMIANALEEKPLPLYGDGLHERDWLFVSDFCRAIGLALDRGVPGEIYNVSTGVSRPNLRVVGTILDALGKPRSLLQHVADRPGHDRRYSLDSTKIRRQLGWQPQVSFEEGVHRTINWYRDNPSWLGRARSGEFRDYYERHYQRRAATLGSIAR